MKLNATSMNNEELQIRGKSLPEGMSSLFERQLPSSESGPPPPGPVGGGGDSRCRGLASPPSQEVTRLVGFSRFLLLVKA